MCPRFGSQPQAAEQVIVELLRPGEHRGFAPPLRAAWSMAHVSSRSLWGRTTSSRDKSMPPRRRQRIKRPPPIEDDQRPSPHA
jgi:hypothetical protein